MQNKIRPFALLLPALLATATVFFSCKKEEPEPPDPTPCTQRWTVLNPAGHSATVSGGDLVLTASDSLLIGEVLTVMQDSLRGDFSVEVSFSGFGAGTSGNGAFCQLVVSNGSAGAYNIAVAGIGTVSPSGTGLQTSAQVTDALAGVVAGDYDTTASTAGTFTLSRTGSNLSITTATGTGTSSVSAVAFNNKALTVGFQLGTNFDNIVGPVTIHLNSFTLTGGGSEVGSDTFDCNSLLP
jgi:hypothetical protein